MVVLGSEEGQGLVGARLTCCMILEGSKCHLMNNLMSIQLLSRRELEDKTRSTFWLGFDWDRFDLRVIMVTFGCPLAEATIHTEYGL